MTLSIISYIPTVIGGGGGGGTPIDYTPQLKAMMDKLIDVIGGIQNHETQSGERHTELKDKLQGLHDLGEAYITLARESQATQEQIKQICQRISDSMSSVTDAIAGFKSAALESIEMMGDLLQREFDQTQAAIAALEATVKEATITKERDTVEEVETVDCQLGAKRIIVPAGACEIVGYADRPTPYTVNGKNFLPGSQFQHSWLAVGNTVATYDEKTFEIPAGCVFHVSYRALRNLGKIAVINSATNRAESRDPLDTEIEVPRDLTSSD